jgi:hypothetical protein
MKKLLLALLVFVSLVGCYQQSYPLITCDYGGEVYVFVFNKTTQDLWVTQKKEITKEDVEKNTGQLGDMDIRASKVTGEDYPDMGQLTLTLWNEDDILAYDIIDDGKDTAQIFYKY